VYAYNITKGKDAVSSYQFVLIADPYSDHKFLKKNDSAAKEEMSEMQKGHTPKGIT
jgi:hypothetical protein